MADDIEVSYHAAGIICHILSDDPSVSIWSATETDPNQPDDNWLAQPTEQDDDDGYDDIPMMDSSEEEEGMY